MQLSTARSARSKQPEKNPFVGVLIKTRIKQLGDYDRQRYIVEVITMADSLRQGETLRMRGTTWIVSAS